MQIGGREFIPVATHRPKRTPWLDGFVDGVPYPYMTDPFEAQHAFAQQQRWAERQKIQFGAFVPGGSSGAARLTAAPTAALQTEILEKLSNIIAADWPECEVCPANVHVTDPQLGANRSRRLRLGEPLASHLHHGWPAAHHNNLWPP